MTTTPPETVFVDTHKLACDGGDASGGHPRVWLHIPDDQGWVECPYCDCRYVHRDHQQASDAA